jgi:hypothetical protein
MLGLDQRDLALAVVRVVVALESSAGDRLDRVDFKDRHAACRSHADPRHAAGLRERREELAE